MQRFTNSILKNIKIVLMCSRNTFRCTNNPCMVINFCSWEVNIARDFAELLKSELKEKQTKKAEDIQA